MPVTVRIPAVLTRYSAGEREVVIEGTTVTAALEGLLARHPDLRQRVLDEAGALHAHLRLFVDGRAATTATCLRPGATVEVVAAVEGG